MYVTLTVIVLAMADRVWRWLAVCRFFRTHEQPLMADPTAFVTVLQPILSGDPTLKDSLLASLSAKNACKTEYLWLVDADDASAREVCNDLIAGYPAKTGRLLLLPQAEQSVNPKTFKLIMGARSALGNYLCVLDDDTRLSNGDLDRAVAALADTKSGLAFGLPYYVNGDTIWSCLLSTFVNLNSATTYIPYLSFSDPLTINGMFYVVERQRFTRIGGFGGLEKYISDDFAVANRVRNSGLRLIQTSICHAVSTSVATADGYLRILNRWFVFPRESLLRHLAVRERTIVAVVAAVPLFLPLLLLISVAAKPHWVGAAGFLALIVFDTIVLRTFVRRYFRDQVPRACSWLVPIVRVLAPLQFAFALLLPQNIIWRGIAITIQKGGAFVRK